MRPLVPHCVWQSYACTHRILAEESERAKMQPVRPVAPMAPLPPYDPGPMPPRTPVLALLGIGMVALGLALLEAFPVMGLSRYLAEGGAVCGLVAAAFALLALARIARFPARYDGRPMALAALVLGLLEALLYGGFVALQVVGYF